MNSLIAQKKQDLLQNWTKYCRILAKECTDQELVRKLDLTRLQIRTAFEQKMPILEVLHLYETLIIEARILKMELANFAKRHRKRRPSFDDWIMDLYGLTAEERELLNP